MSHINLEKADGFFVRSIYFNKNKYDYTTIKK